MKRTATARPLADVLDEDVLLRMAGQRTYERGREYYVDGQVLDLVEHEGTITARVEGTYVYRVKLLARGDALGYSCTCPHYGEGAFCKHCVATGLAWLDARDADAAPPPASAKTGKKGKRKKSVTTMESVREYLAGREKTELVSMLVEQAVEDERLRRRLLAKAAANSPEGFDLDAYREIIDAALAAGEPEYYEDTESMNAYLRGIEDAIDGIEEMIADGHPDEAIDLAEHAINGIEMAIEVAEYVGDDLSDLLQRCQDIHLRACEAARPDPEELARRLFAWELRSKWDTFAGAADTYGDILGENGLAVYRLLAEAEWAKIADIHTDAKPVRYGDRKGRLAEIMELFAGEAGDPDAIIAVKKRNLTFPEKYVELAEILRGAGRDDEALEYAEKGLDAFPQWHEPRLREFVFDEYVRRGRNDEAMKLAWRVFLDHPVLANFEYLKTHAERVHEWRHWRERALANLRNKIEAVKSGKSVASIDGWMYGLDASELVNILLSEGDADTAWQEAQAWGCRDDLWLKLVRTREESHPDDVLPVYQRLVERMIAHQNATAYEGAVEMLRSVRGIMIRIGREAEFRGYFASVREAHKHKRNLMKLLKTGEWENVLRR